jgi:ABC-2 type transport system permease protein
MTSSPPPSDVPSSPLSSSSPPPSAAPSPPTSPPTQPTSPPSAPRREHRSRWLGTLRLLLRQARYENRAFWRNPASAFFTFVFPLVVMVIFNLILASGVGGAGLEGGARFYTPAIIAFSVVNACFTNLAMSVAIVRDEGVLKRIHGTPLPTGAYLAARILHAVLVALILAVIVAVFGLVAYGVPLPIGHAAEVAAVLVLGSAVFCALGLAVAGLVPNASAAPAVVNAIVLPLLFVSNVFVRIDAGPLVTVGGLFPVRPFSTALLSAYGTPGAGPLDPATLAWLAAWGILGLVVALRTFTWEPRT